MSENLQLIVDYLDGHTSYFPVTQEQGWKIDVTHRCLIVGRGVPRQIIPLDNVAVIQISEISKPLPKAI